VTQSTERILTTHVGALQRPTELTRALVAARDDAAAASEQLRNAVADVVRTQAEVGIDIVDDGEYGKSIWQWYVTERLTGFERRPFETPLLVGRDRNQFKQFYAYADRTPGVLFYGEDQAFWEAIATQPVCVAPIVYRPDAVRRDIANFQAALQNVAVVDGFMPAVAPASIEVGVKNEHYGTDEELLQALTEAMRQEYRAIVDAGIQLQVDDAWIPALWDHEASLDKQAYLAFCQRRVEALNDALAGLPEERVRYHICWGSWHGPHATDIPLAEIVDLMLQVRAGTYLFESANARHEHEYHLWETVALPEGKRIAPGIVTHATNVTEHPELVAERIMRFAERVGRDNVIASTDCGMEARIHPELGWAKLRALADGAALATERLWGQGAATPRVARQGAASAG